MSISTIAAELYTIQARKNVPLKTAFSMIVREDLAMRFSVYNLARIITKSEFIATVAQTAFGKRTPLQRKQDKQQEEKEKADNDFKRFTTSSIATLNRRIGLLTTIAERNSQLISNLYSELGSGRTQRRIDPRFLMTAVRVQMPSKTVKGKLDLIAKELEVLKKQNKKQRERIRGTTAKKKTKQEEAKDQKSFLDNALPFLLRNPRILALMAGGAAAAVSVGSFAAQAAALFNLTKSFERTMGRFQGEPGFEMTPEDKFLQMLGLPTTEEISKVFDAGVLGISAATVTSGGIYAASKIRERIRKRKMATPTEGRMQLINQYTKEFRSQGYEYREAQRLAGQKVKKMPEQINRFKPIMKAFKGGAKIFAPIAAADVAITLAQMSGYVSDKSMGKISDQQFKAQMVGGYSDLISTVGLTGFGTILGGAAGTFATPIVGTLLGALGGGLTGYLASIYFEDDLQGLAETVFELIHGGGAATASTETGMVASINESRRVAGVAGSMGEQQVTRPPVSPSTPILSSLLERGESRAFGGYTAYNQKVGNTFKAGRADLEKLTVNDIIGAQSRGQFFAVGKYQLIPTTLKAAKEKLGLTGNEKFTPQLQEHIFANYLIGDKRPAIRDYLNGTSDNLEAALLALAQEWASVSTEYDQMKSYYAKDKASISKREAASALKYERERRLSLRSQGVNVSVMPAPAPQVPPISTTPNAMVSEPPRSDATVSTTAAEEKVEIQDAQITSQAALQVSAAMNGQITRVQEQINSHDSRISIQERNSRTNLARNTEFEKYLA